MNAPLMQTARRLYRNNRRLLFLCRLHRPADIPLFLLPGLWASLLAADGTPRLAPLLALLLAALMLRCAAWVFNDWMEARQLPNAPESFVASRIVTPREAQLLLAGLLLGALLLILPQGVPLLYYAMPALALLLAYPLVRIRTLLSQAYLGLCYAWLVPLAWTAQGAAPGKGAWLIFTAVLLWATALTTLHAVDRRRYEQRVGIGSLAQIFGHNSWMLILASQLGAVLALWLASRQLQLGIFFDISLVVVLLLLPYQQWLLFSQPQAGARRSFLSQIWSAVALLCGIAFHFICLG